MLCHHLLRGYLLCIPRISITSWKSFFVIYFSYICFDFLIAFFRAHILLVYLCTLFFYGRYFDIFVFLFIAFGPPEYSETGRNTSSYV